MNNNKLLKSTMEGVGKLFQIPAMRSVKKWRLTFIRLVFKKIL